MFSTAFTAAALLFCSCATAQTTTLTTKPADLSTRPVAKIGANTTYQPAALRQRMADPPKMSLMTVGPVITTRSDAPAAYRSAVAGSVDGNVSVTAGRWLAPANPRARALDDLMSRGAVLPPVDLGPGPTSTGNASRGWTETPLRVSSASAGR